MQIGTYPRYLGFFLHAFCGIIWRDLHSELGRFIESKVADRNAAQDILQDVFVKVHLNINQLKDSTKLTSWIYQIARNTIADHFRNAGVEKQPVEHTLAEDESVEPLYASLSECIKSKISKLPKEEYRAIVLTYFENCSQKELAELLGMSYSGIKSRVQRTREKLKKSVLACDNVIAQDGKITETLSQ